MKEWVREGARCPAECSSVSNGRAACHCGWYGPSRDDDVVARRDREQHAGPADGIAASARGCPECIEAAVLAGDTDRLAVSAAWRGAAETIPGNSAVEARRKLLLRRSANVARQLRESDPWRERAAEIRAWLRSRYTAHESTQVRTRVSALVARGRSAAEQAVSCHATGEEGRATAFEQAAAQARLLAARRLAADESPGLGDADLQDFWMRFVKALSVAQREFAAQGLNEAAQWLQPYEERARNAVAYASRRFDKEEKP